MVKEFASAAAKAAFEMSKETGTSVAAILGGAAVLVGALCTGAAQIIEAKNKYKKTEEK